MAENSIVGLRKARTDLSKWQSSAEMLGRANTLMDDLGSKSLFNQTGLNFILEAWIGARFASIKFPGCQIRLHSDEWPDLEVDCGAAKQFEITEAQIPGRRRGDEYKNLQTYRDYPMEDLHRAASAIPTALETAARNKAAKRYADSKCGLIIYLNVGPTSGLRREEMIAAIPNAVSVARERFSEVFVLWGDEVF